MRSLVLLLAASGCAATSSEITAPTVVADPAAPAFTLPSAQGRTVSLAESLAAGHVVLVFYRGHW